MQTGLTAAMKKLLWLATIMAMGIWSLLAWGAWSLFSLIGGSFAESGGGWIMRGLSGLGALTVGLIWALGALIIVAFAFLAIRLTGSAQTIVVFNRKNFRFKPDRGRDDRTVDLDPDEWREAEDGDRRDPTQPPRLGG